MKPSGVSWPGGTILGSLPDTTRQALLAAGRLHRYPAGTMFIMEGATTTDVFLLIDGWAKVVGATEDGDTALLAIRVGGDIVGEQAALDNRPRTASVISASTIVARVIQQAAFLRFLTDWPDANLAVSRALSAKLRWATYRQIDFSGLSVETRLARVMSELVRLDGTEVTGGVESRFHLTQPELASMVGASETSVQRALRKLRREGVITTGYRKVVVHDQTALEAVAGWAEGGPLTS